MYVVMLHKDSKAHYVGSYGNLEVAIAARDVALSLPIAHNSTGTGVIH